jgi:hypothetical protein
MSEKTMPLPCPFCGGAALTRIGFHLSCVRCGTEGPDADDASEEAIEARWNRRAPVYPETQPGAPGFDGAAAWNAQAATPLTEPGAWMATRLWNRRELWTCPADIAIDLGAAAPAAQQAATPAPVAYADKIAFESAMRAGKGCDVWPTRGDGSREVIALYAAPTPAAQAGDGTVKFEGIDDTAEMMADRERYIAERGSPKSAMEAARLQGWVAGRHSMRGEKKGDDQ